MYLILVIKRRLSQRRYQRRRETFPECQVIYILPNPKNSLIFFSTFTSMIISLLLILCVSDPDAEVVALSPKTLLASNRFVCEICNKGFQRDQNLQLHRRGHNLPWKLKQRTSREPRKQVYVCPEPACVHHNPARALGDLTGIKKHFCRKHGEKKWKCERCSKNYAVQSDWKAHMKICGSREYKCDCGSLFSRFLVLFISDSALHFLSVSVLIVTNISLCVFFFVLLW